MLKNESPAVVVPTTPASEYDAAKTPYLSGADDLVSELFAVAETVDPPFLRVSDADEFLDAPRKPMENGESTVTLSPL